MGQPTLAAPTSSLLTAAPIGTHASSLQVWCWSCFERLSPTRWRPAPRRPPRSLHLKPRYILRYRLCRRTTRNVSRTDRSRQTSGEGFAKNANPTLVLWFSTGTYRVRSEAESCYRFCASRGLLCMDLGAVRHRSNESSPNPRRVLRVLAESSPSPPSPRRILAHSASAPPRTPCPAHTYWRSEGGA
jgi:hypothetical protein